MNDRTSSGQNRSEPRTRTKGSEPEWANLYTVAMLTLRRAETSQSRRNVPSAGKKVHLQVHLPDAKLSDLQITAENRSSPNRQICNGLTTISNTLHICFNRLRSQRPQV